MKVVVVGAGKMGLPLACQIAARGANVIACDVNPIVVETINRGASPIDEPGVAALLAQNVAEGRLTASTDTAGSARDADFVIVIVPALLTAERDVDTSILQAVARQISGSLKRGSIVSFETTLPVGGTRRFLIPALEEGGKKAGVDFDVVFSPERVKSQHVLRNLTVNPKIVGGTSVEVAARGAAFYEQYVGAPVINVGSLEAAEFVKLGGMIYRDVNIALANQLARYAEMVGVDLPALIPAINSDGEAALLSPGIGVGGHCTPVYPYFLIQDAQRRGEPQTLAAISRTINDGQAEHAIARLERAIGSLQGAHVQILGLAFRPEVKEHIYSSAFLLREVLAARGARVTLHDPMYTGEEIRAHGFEPVEAPFAGAPVAVVLNTAHPTYRTLAFGAGAPALRAVVDGRNAWSKATVESARLVYLGIGRT